MLFFVCFVLFVVKDHLLAAGFTRNTLHPACPLEHPAHTLDPTQKDIRIANEYGGYESALLIAKKIKADSQGTQIQIIF